MIMRCLLTCPGAEVNLFKLNEKNTKNIYMLCHNYLKTLYMISNNLYYLCTTLLPENALLISINQIKISLFFEKIVYNPFFNKQLLQFSTKFGHFVVHRDLTRSRFEKCPDFGQSFHTFDKSNQI